MPGFLEVSLKSNKEMEEFIRAFPKESALAARDAVNTTTKFAYAEASREIRKQVNLSQSYIGSAEAGNRLKIARRATEENPSAVISARTRPVSLARFALDKSLRRRGGVSVSVKPGATKRMASAFIIRLRAGKQITDDQFNLGLAIRVKPGTTLINKRATPFGTRDPNLFLLYGPSVDQVFSSVRSDIAPKVEDFLANEYIRQFDRHIK
jgi:hypothetical protein